MELSLHANATTTPKVRGYIQRSRRPVAELAAELGVSETTIRRWRDRTTVGDRSHTPKRLTVSLSPMEEALVCELRMRLQLPLDDITEVMHRCLNPKLSRSAIHRCLKRHVLNQRPKPDKPPVGVFEQASVGFIHIDIKHLPALERRKSYAFVAIEPVIGHMKSEGHLGRCYLKGRAGDAINAVLSAVGHNLRRVLAWLRKFFAPDPGRPISPPSPIQSALNSASVRDDNLAPSTFPALTRQKGFLGIARQNSVNLSA